VLGLISEFRTSYLLSSSWPLITGSSITIAVAAATVLVPLGESSITIAESACVFYSVEANRVTIVAD
jgi:hypothetical protein